MLLHLQDFSSRLKFSHTFRHSFFSLNFPSTWHNLRDLRKTVIQMQPAFLINPHSIVKYTHNNNTPTHTHEKKLDAYAKNKSPTEMFCDTN